MGFWFMRCKYLAFFLGFSDNYYYYLYIQHRHPEVILIQHVRVIER